MSFSIRHIHQRLLRDTLGVKQHKNLVKQISSLLPDSPLRVIDIGSGNCLFSSLLMQSKSNLQITCMEIKEVPMPLMETHIYDGKILPFPDNYFDYSLLINMLHHTDNSEDILCEAKRVSKIGIIVKDHYANNKLNYFTLVLMERIGNMFSDINQPYNFISERGWHELFDRIGLKTTRLLTKFTSYNVFLDIFFGRNLHFIALLSPII